MTSVRFSFRLSPETRRQLESEAKALHRPVSRLATQAIEQFLDARTARRRMLEAAVDEADKGVFISEEAMDRWVASWGTDNELSPPEPGVFLKKSME